ncbi:MAG: hypothetical protein KDK36_08710 [Leptospiraceae bacterium]|nr:hypothetical protein [Leptospiraceae bacterium]
MIKKISYLFLIISFVSITFCGDSKKEETENNTEKKEDVKSESNGGDSSKLEDGSSAVTTTAVVVRDGPGKENGKHSCYEYGDNYELDGKDGWECASVCTRNISALPKGTKVRIVGSGESEVKVDKWTDYWYQIQIEQENIHCDDEKGQMWLFGEFLKKQE